MNKPLITVIVPIYNASRYLAECLDSITKQSYKNLEIICVDDGSTDSSVSIVKKYIRQDDRICLISQENSGQSAARNKALRMAQGEYISFIDSDDIIDKNFFSKAVSTFSKYKVDAVIYNMQMFLPSGETFICFSGTLYPDNNGCIKPSRDERCINITNAAPVVFCRKKIQHCFIEGMIYEDWVFMVDFISSASSIYWLNLPFYKYRRDFEKTTTSNISKKCLDLFKAYRLSKEIIQQRNMDHHYAFINDVKILNEGIGFIEARLLNTKNYNSILEAFIESLIGILSTFSLPYFYSLISFIEFNRGNLLKIVYYEHCLTETKGTNVFRTYQKLKKHVNYTLRCKKLGRLKVAMFGRIKRHIKAGVFSFSPAYRMATYNNQLLQYEILKTEKELNEFSLRLKKLEKSQKKLGEFMDTVAKYCKDN